jgi:pyrroline-5-carboxylate reductase
VRTFTTAFIGAGNMARSIIGGLLTAGFDAGDIGASDPLDENLVALQTLGLRSLATDNATVAANADVVVLAVKPQLMREVCLSLAPVMRDDMLVISIAAGVPAASLSSWLGGRARIVRCMPNTPALLGLGASGLYAHGDVPASLQDRAQTVLEAVGVVRWVSDEDLLHAVTAVSGSGPAYFFLFMEAMIAEARRMGLDAESARTLCAQTCIGAGHMLADSDVDATELRRRVTSPGGTTERAVASFEAAGLADTVGAAMRDCHTRSQELAAELS